MQDCSGRPALRITMSFWTRTTSTRTPCNSSHSRFVMFMPAQPAPFLFQRRFTVGHLLLLRLPDTDFTAQTQILFARVPRITLTRHSTWTSPTRNLRHRILLTGHPQRRFLIGRRPTSPWLRLRSEECTFLNQTNHSTKARLSRSCIAFLPITFLM